MGSVCRMIYLRSHSTPLKPSSDLSNLMFLQRGETRLRHKEFVFPVVVGTCAFYLGKKVHELCFHAEILLKLLISMKTAHRQCPCM